MQRRELANSAGLLVIRAGVGAYMLTHGLGKLKMLLDGNFEMMGDPLGLGPELSLVLVACAEFACAALVVLGLATRFAAIPLVFAMGVAAFLAHGSDPWTMEEGARLFMTGQAEFWGSKEPALVYLFVFLGIALTGPGRFSMDELIRQRLANRKSADNTSGV